MRLERAAENTGRAGLCSFLQRNHVSVVTRVGALPGPVPHSNGERSSWESEAPAEPQQPQRPPLAERLRSSVILSNSAHLEENIALPCDSAG